MSAVDIPNSKEIWRQRSGRWLVKGNLLIVFVIV